MKRNMTRLLAFWAFACLLCILCTLPAMAEMPFVPDDLSSPVIDAVTDGVAEAEAAADGFFANLLGIDSLEEANAAMSNYSIGILLITALIALIMAFFGYRTLRIALLLGSFSAGFLLGTNLYRWVLGAGLLASLEPIPEFVPVLSYILCGVLVAILAMRVLRAAIFLTAAAGVYFFLSSIPATNMIIDRLITEETDAKYWIAKLVVSLIIGALAIVITRPVLIITTGAAGGMVAAVAIMVAIEQTGNTDLEMVLGIILAGLGIIVQFSTGRRRRARR